MALIHPRQYTTYVFATAPTVTDDSAAGYKAGDRWVRTGATPALRQEYICYDASAGAAIWETNQDAVAAKKYYATATAGVDTFTGTATFTAFFPASPGAPAAVKDSMQFIRGVRVPNAAVSFSGLDLLIDTALLGYGIGTGDIVESDYFVD